MAYTQTLRPESHLSRAINGETYYGYDLMIAGSVLEQLRIANWQRGGRSARRPKAIKWPWLPKSEDDQTYGTAAPVTDIRDFLVYRNGRAPTTND